MLFPISYLSILSRRSSAQRLVAGVHDVAVVVVHGEDGYVDWEGAQDQLAAVCEEARIFDGRVESLREAVRDSFNPSCERLLPQSPF